MLLSRTSEEYSQAIFVQAADSMLLTGILVVVAARSIKTEIFFGMIVFYKVGLPLR